MGILIGEVDEHSKGYGTDAIQCLLDYGFNQLNLNSIELHVFDFNAKAKRCYEKCGFKEIGHRRQAYFNNGKYHDAIYMDITREDFTAKSLQ
ncbi:MAG: GNAT family N-acetyltransferase [Candidatus Peribacteria bacterium]|nr:GNAT family N-acetyltransferase [Candidatus Peribacteria bacterium]